MNILLISNYGRETETSFQFKIIHAFEDMGHKMGHLYPMNGPIVTQLAKKKMKPPDVILYMEGLLFENPNWLKLPFNIPKIWWFLDTPVLFKEQVMWYKITDANLALVRDRREISRFEKEGLKCVWAPPKINPSIFNAKFPSMFGEERNYDVGFFGWIDKARYDWLDGFGYVSDSVYGAGIAPLDSVPKFTYFYQKERWPETFMVDFYRKCKIVPHRTGRYSNSGTAAVGVQGDITWRPFEATGCGAMFLTEEFDAIDDLFVRDKEIVVYDMNDESTRLELAAYYLEHDDELEKIAKAGYDRTMKDHTWKSAMDIIEAEVKKIGV